MTQIDEPLNQALLVGIDVGTTNIKAAIFTAAGRVVSEASLPTPTNSASPGQAYYHAEELWAAVIKVLRQATAAVPQPSAIVGVAVASMGEAGVPLDSHGHPLAETLAWFDQRPTPQAIWLEQTVGREKLFAITGLTPLPIFGLPKILWLLEHRHEAVTNMKCWLHIAEYIAFRLCGVQATDPSLASRTLLFNLEKRIWDTEILQAAGLEPSLMAEIRESGTPLGTVLSEAAELTGLPTTAVVSTGGQDHVCGALALGVIAPGTVLNSLGTAEVMLAVVQSPVRDPRFAEQGFAQGAHVVPGLYYAFGAMFSSGASVDWCRTLLVATAPEAYSDLLLEAAKVPLGSRGAVFLPHLHLANAPHEDPQGRGALIGLRPEHDRAVALRAVLEGLAFESRLSLESLEPYLGVASKQITAIGGSTRNDLLMGIKASVLGRTFEIPNVPEAVCLGAALLAGVGAGVYANAIEASNAVQTQRHQVNPNSAHTTDYQQRFEQVYSPLVTTLKSLNRSIAMLENH